MVHVCPVVTVEIPAATCSIFLCEPFSKNALRSIHNKFLLTVEGRPPLFLENTLDTRYSRRLPISCAAQCCAGCGPEVVDARASRQPGDAAAGANRVKH